jgi:hypothetical protein
MQTFFVQWFHPSLLELHRITFADTPGQLLEKVVEYEAVHQITTLEQLKRRIGTGRRCLVFCHPTMPLNPLAILHIALMPGVANGMEDIDQRATDTVPPRAAIFYSVSSTQPGLRGIDMGNLLIKAAVPWLQQQFGSLETFVTLSPIPALRSWILTSEIDGKVAFDPGNADHQEEAAGLFEVLGRQGLLEGMKLDSPLSTIRDIIQDEHWHQTKALVDPLRPFLMRLGAYYLVVEKSKGGTIPCSVGNFHSRNGAEIYQLNYMADRSENGIKQSCGMMVNYLYDLPRVGQNREEYLESKVVHPSQGVLDLLL